MMTPRGEAGEREQFFRELHALYDALTSSFDWKGMLKLGSYESKAEKTNEDLIIGNSHTLRAVVREYLASEFSANNFDFEREMCRMCQQLLQLESSSLGYSDVANLFVERVTPILKQFVFGSGSEQINLDSSSQTSLVADEKGMSGDKYLAGPHPAEWKAAAECINKMMNSDSLTRLTSGNADICRKAYRYDELIRTAPTAKVGLACDVREMLESFMRCDLGNIQKPKSSSGSTSQIQQKMLDFNMGIMTRELMEAGKLAEKMHKALDDLIKKYLAKKPEEQRKDSAKFEKELQAIMKDFGPKLVKKSNELNKYEKSKAELVIENNALRRGGALLHNCAEMVNNANDKKNQKTLEPLLTSVHDKLGLAPLVSKSRRTKIGDAGSTAVSKVTKVTKVTKVRSLQPDESESDSVSSGVKSFIDPGTSGASSHPSIKSIFGDLSKPSDGGVGPDSEGDAPSSAPPPPSSPKSQR